MNFLGDRSIGFKIITLSAVLAAIFLGSSFGYVLIKIRTALIEETRKTHELEVLQEAEKINLLTREVRNITLSLKGTPPFQGIIRAREGGGFDVSGGSTLAQWQGRLQAIFAAEMNATGVYDQMRFLDETGQELVRVDFVNGRAQVVPSGELQNKGDRDYFLETRQLSEGDVYVSHTELNREGTPPIVSVPHRPVIRYATPVFSNTDGSFRGIFVVNALVENLVARSELHTDPMSSIFITNSRGYFILHPDVDKEWGGPLDLNTGFSLATEFPEIHDLLRIGQNGSLLTTKGLVSFAKALPDSADESREWIVFDLTPNSVISGPINTIAIGAAVVGLGTFLVLFLVFTFVIRHLLRPLDELAVGVTQVGRGDFATNIPVHSRDEIGRVAETFNTMAAKLKTMYSSLETQVADKTKDLDKKVKELSDSQRAMTNVLEDVETEKRRAQDLSSDLEKFKLAADSASDHIIITDSKGVILYANAAAERVTGFPRNEILGTKAGKLWGGLMDKAFYEAMWKTIATDKKSFSGEIRNKRKNGEEYVAFSTISPILGTNGEAAFYVGIERDITKEKQIDQAKTEFVSLASHQLRTPLTSINWYAEMLLAGDAGKLTDEQRKYLEEIYTGNQRMVELVNSLLNVSRLELGTFVVEPEPTDPAVLMRSVIDEQKAQIDARHIDLRTDIATSMGTIQADPKLLRMVFQNLLSNATKYTPEKGAVSVHMARDNENVVLSVSDTGIGIPKSEQGKLFSKLFRATNARESDTDGTGLGLYIVKSVVEHSGGTIRFESEEGKGTTFYVSLPVGGMVRKAGTKKLS